MLVALPKHSIHVIPPLCLASDQASYTRVVAAAAASTRGALGDLRLRGAGWQQMKIRHSAASGDDA
jgi:hypothetical protein